MTEKTATRRGPANRARAFLRLAFLAWFLVLNFSEEEATKTVKGSPMLKASEFCEDYERACGQPCGNLGR